MFDDILRAYELQIPIQLDFVLRPPAANYESGIEQGPAVVSALLPFSPTI